MGSMLAGKVAIVTGASSGIGKAAARLFAEEGAKVVIGARRKEVLDTLVEEIAANNGEAIAIAGDVKDEMFANALVETAIERFGGSTWRLTMPGLPARWAPRRMSHSKTGARRSRRISPALSSGRRASFRRCSNEVAAH